MRTPTSPNEQVEVKMASWESIGAGLIAALGVIILGINILVWGGVPYEVSTVFQQVVAKLTTTHHILVSFGAFSLIVGAALLQALGATRQELCRLRLDIQDQKPWALPKTDV